MKKFIAILLSVAMILPMAIMPTRFRQLHGYWDSPEISSDSYGTPAITVF